MNKLKMIATVSALGFMLTACSDKNTPSSETTTSTETTTEITTTVTEATTTEPTETTVVTTQPIKPTTADEAVKLYMTIIEADSYKQGARFFYEYHILDEKKDGDNVTLMVYSIRSWIDSDYKECSGGAGVTGINFAIKDGIWEYKDRFDEDHVNIEEKYGSFPYQDMRNSHYENIAVYLKENYEGEIRPTSTIRNITYSTSYGDEEYKDKWFLDLYYNEFYYDNKKTIIEEDKVNEFINDSNKFGFDIWESSYPPVGMTLDNWHNWKMSIIYLDGTEKIIECEYLNPVTWNAMYDVFNQITGIDNIL